MTNKDDIKKKKIKDILDFTFSQKQHVEIPEKCAEISKNFTKKDYEAVNIANNEISKRNSYGRRRIDRDENGIIILWSNGSKEWGITHKSKSPNRTLDANQVFLPISPERFKRIKGCLGVLPLYFGSLNSFERGETSSAENFAIWANGHIKRMKNNKK